MIETPCIILAGGKSSRMQEDKSLLQIHDTTLIEYQYNKLSKLFTNIYISSKTNKFDFDVHCILDKKGDYSPMIALESILAQLDTEKIFIIPVDTPNLQNETINQLITKSENFDIPIPINNNKTHNLIGVFSKKILPTIKKLLQENNHKLQNLINLSNTNIIEFQNKDEFLNLNTKEDLNYFLSKQL